MRGRHLTIEEQKKVRELYESGLHPSEIGRQMGLHRSTVLNRLNGVGIKPPLERMAPTPEQLEHCERLLAKGVSLTNAARLTGIARSTIAGRYGSAGGMVDSDKPITTRYRGHPDALLEKLGEHHGAS